MNKPIPRHIALFPISVVMKLTQLSGRQIRYYEEQKLIQPIRNKGNQRLFSLNDIQRLVEIKKLVDQGINIAGIKAVYQMKHIEENSVLQDPDQLDLDLTEIEKLINKE